MISFFGEEERKSEQYGSLGLSVRVYDRIASGHPDLRVMVIMMSHLKADDESYNIRDCADVTIRSVLIDFYVV